MTDDTAEAPAPADPAQIRRAAAMAADWWTRRLLRGDKEAFRARLQELVEERLKVRAACYLVCDYDPQGMVLEAVRAAGIECRGVTHSADGILPRKHSLMVRRDRLEPKEGYGNFRPDILVAADDA